jgi:fibronectin type 3 domain-containing protein
MAGYRVYRGTTSGFGSATMIADESLAHDSASPDFTDTEVVNCRSFNYWVTAVDACGVESTASAMATGSSTTADAPQAPANAQVFFARGAARVTWEKVEKDVNDHPIFIDTYNIYRSPLVPLSGDPDSKPALGTFTYIGSSTTWLNYRDAVTVPDGYTVYYYVTAVDDCGNMSAPSELVNPQCTFVGDVAFLAPADNTPVAGVVRIVVAATAVAVEYAGITLDFTHEVSGATTSVKIDEVGPLWSYEWLANPPGPYTITATVVNAEGCAKTASIHVAAGTDVGCCLSPPTPDLDPITMACVGGRKVECAELEYEVINNNCLTAVAIEQLTIDWRDLTTLSPHLTGVFLDNSPIWNVTPPAGTPAIQRFSDPKPSIDVSRNTSNPVTVTYTYDANMSERLKGTWFQNTMITSFDYRLLDADGNETAITGTCGPSTGMFDNMLAGLP